MRADVVVVGAGPAGCVMARRLADAGADVVLVDSGDHPASARAGLLDVGPDSRIVTRYRATLGATIFDLPRGRTLGGSGAVNGGYCVPATPADIAAWGPDWPRRYASGLARAAERLRPGLAPFDPVAAHLAAAFPGRVEAVAQARRGGRRVTAFDAWDPAGAGVRVLTGATVRELRWAGGRVGGRCDGVVLAGGDPDGPGSADRPDRRDGHHDDKYYDAKNYDDDDEITADEVVLCAGSVGSAALLLGSGLGPDSGHPVGRATQEHPEVLLDLPADLLENLPGLGGDVPAMPGAGDAPLPALLSHVIRVEIPGAMHGVDGSAEFEVRPYAVPLHRVIPGLEEVPHRIGVALMNPVGRGRVGIGEGGELTIDLADDPRDASALAAATALVADRLGIAAADRRVGVSTSQHLSGTARIGEVVDDAGRVLGVDGLRVADASVLPWLPRRGPYYTVLVMAEVLAEKMVETRS